MDGHNTPQTTNPNGTSTENFQTRVPSRSQVTVASDWLQDNNRTGTYFIRSHRHRRYVDLKKDVLFTQLTRIYYSLFNTHWTKIKHLVISHMEQLTTPYPGSAQAYAAAVYVSSWYHDTYVANRRATYKLSDAAYSEHFNLDIVEKSREYDLLLVTLSSHLRPTNVKLVHEDTLFIPRFSATINHNANNQNYFNINGWYTNDDLLKGLLHVLKDQKLLRITETTDNTVGRPSWLFDWHGDKIYAWFPTHENYNMDDVSIAYIIGAACTPKLAPRDYDEWQTFPNNVVPQRIITNAYRRFRTVSYHAAVEINVIETRDYTPPNSICDYYLRTIAQLMTGRSDFQSAAFLKSVRTQGQPSTQQAHPRKRIRGSSPSTTGATHISEDASVIGDSNDNEDPDDQATNMEDDANATSHTPPTSTAMISTPISVEAPKLHQYRVVTYLYYLRVSDVYEDASRLAAARKIASE